MSARTRRIWGIVAVISGEHHIVVVPKCISSITRVPSDRYLVILCLAEYNEPAVLGILPAAIEYLHIKSQLIGTAGGQLMQQFVAEPVVAYRVVESNFKLLPRTFEEVGSVDLLVDQQRNTAGCRTNKHKKTVPPQREQRDAAVNFDVMYRTLQRHRVVSLPQPARLSCWSLSMSMLALCLKFPKK